MNHEDYAQLKKEEKVERACEWIELLASNDYPQQKGSLAKGKSRCCLGVLRDVVESHESNNVGNLTASTCFEAGLKYSAQTTLATANDEGFSHSEIARGILEKPSDFFEASVAKMVAEYFNDNVDNE